MTTVADILAARPSLRDRATEAANIAAEVEMARRHDEETDLIREACVWLGEVAQCSPAEIEDLDFMPTAYSSNGSERQVMFTLDRVNLKVRFESTNVMTSNSSQFATERITERVLRVDVQKTNGSWVQVRTLADIGKELRS